MKLIAVTGGIGSGKSVVSAEFEKLGAYLIDADEVSHTIMSGRGSSYQALIKEFGNDILDENNDIDRKQLAKIVFSDEKKLENLNGIMHKEIYLEIKRRINTSNAEYICIELPLLFSTECPLEFDIKITVSAPLELRIQRVMERNGFSRDEVIRRVNNQLSDEEMCKRADLVIVNDDGLLKLKNEVASVMRNL